MDVNLKKVIIFQTLNLRPSASICGSSFLNISSQLPIVRHPLRGCLKGSGFSFEWPVAPLHFEFSA
jgi:hypothetical protein